LENNSGKDFKKVKTLLILKIIKEIRNSIPDPCRMQGADLVGIRYEQLLPFALPYQNPENAFRVISGDFN
jgi:isoleucyl-tRNA synthetase